MNYDPSRGVLDVPYEFKLRPVYPAINLYDWPPLQHDDTDTIAIPPRTTA
jgi:hypothetical protein